MSFLNSNYMFKFELLVRSVFTCRIYWYVLSFLQFFLKEEEGNSVLNCVNQQSFVQAKHL